MNIKTLVKISRPRFWLYAAGTFWVGVAAGFSSIEQLYNPWIYIYLLYFIFPANLFIYGINDLGDNDTDQHNQKKTDKEHLLHKQERRSLKFWVISSLLLGIVLAIFAPNDTTKILWAVFLFLAFWYSTPPLRFKARPFIDALSNVHYAVIGFLAYSFFTGEFPPVWAMVSAWAWTASMHIFSAIPDIESDTKANLQTTAIYFGEKVSMWVCFLLWIISALLIIFNLDSVWVWLALIFPLLNLWWILSKRSAASVYWYYPYINAVLGLVLFAVLFLPKI